MTRGDDALTALAPRLRVQPELQDFCRFGGTWRSPHAEEERGWAAFHMVARGACSMERPGQRSIRLEAGDVLLLPHGDRHLVYDGDPLQPAAPVTVTDGRHIRLKQTDGVAIRTELICGRLHLEAAWDGLLLRTLPYVIVSRTCAQSPHSVLVTAIRDELEQGRAAAAAIASDLASALFVMLLRQYLEAEPPPAGLLSLLGVRETARAAAAMLNEPARDWKLDQLAAIAATSRASLVRAFRRQCGLPPLAFLSEVRLHMARGRILQTADRLGEIAHAVGYRSEAALSRAMFRRFEIRPGALRKLGGFSPGCQPPGSRPRLHPLPATPPHRP